MSNIEVIEIKISSIKKYLQILDRYKKYSVEQIKKDVDLRGAVERYLYLAVQATIDLAEATIAYKDFRRPAAFSEAFDILSEMNIIKDKNLIEKLISMVGFRNIIAHDYGKINYNIVYDILQNRLKDIEKFIKIIKEIR